MEHTEDKWEAKPSTDEDWVIMTGNIVISRLSRKDFPERNETYAKRIVTAVNSHDELVEACRLLMKAVNINTVGKKAENVSLTSKKAYAAGKQALANAAKS